MGTVYSCSCFDTIWKQRDSLDFFNKPCFLPPTILKGLTCDLPFIFGTEFTIQSFTLKENCGHRRRPDARLHAALGWSSAAVLVCLCFFSWVLGRFLWCGYILAGFIHCHSWSKTHQENMLTIYWWNFMHPKTSALNFFFIKWHIEKVRADVFCLTQIVLGCYFGCMISPSFFSP